MQQWQPLYVGLEAMQQSCERASPIQNMVQSSTNQAKGSTYQSAQVT